MDDSNNLENNTADNNSDTSTTVGGNLGSSTADNSNTDASSSNSNNSLFRQKSLDSLTESTDLNSKIKIATPGIISVVVAICVITVGFIVWANLYKIESTQPVLLVKDSQNQTKCIMRTELSDYIKICKYKKVYLGEDPYTLNIDDGQVEYDFINLTDDPNDIISRGIIEQELNYKNSDKYYVCTVDNLQLQNRSDIGYAVYKKESPLAYLLNYDWTVDSKL